jgi:hypothetical protein
MILICTHCSAETMAEFQGLLLALHEGKVNLIARNYESENEFAAQEV